MQEKYEGLCALVGKTGICHQCTGLQMIAPEGRKGGPFPDVVELADRMAVVRAAEPGSMAGMHDVIWRRTKKIEKSGIGSTTPDAGCGKDATKARPPPLHAEGLGETPV